MSGFLKKEEEKIVEELKKKGVLQKITPGELTDITKNGGISVICADGDIDVRRYHRKSINPRAHSPAPFGGFLIFCKSFRGFNPAYAYGFLENILWGMEAKDTETFFLYPHWPCGVATKFKYEMLEVIDLLPEAINFFHPVSKKIHTFLHLKMMINGEVKEKTYKLII
jgi:hypothetical protein